MVDSKILIICADNKLKKNFNESLILGNSIKWNSNLSSILHKSLILNVVWKENLISLHQLTENLTNIYKQKFFKVIIILGDLPLKSIIKLDLLHSTLEKASIIIIPTFRKLPINILNKIIYRINVLEQSNYAQIWQFRILNNEWNEFLVPKLSMTILK